MRCFCIAVALWSLVAVAQTRVVAPNQVVGLAASTPIDPVQTSVTRDCPGPALTRTSPGVLTIGKNWSASTPCVFMTSGGATATVTQGAVITLADSFPIDEYGVRRAGMAYVYFVPPAGGSSTVIQVAIRSQQHVSCSGCVLNSTLQNFPMFPSNSVPIGTWGIDDTIAPAKWEPGGLSLLDELEVYVDETLEAVFQQQNGSWLLRLGPNLIPKPRIVSAPQTSSAQCTPGDEAFSDNGKMYYRCVHIPALYGVDGRVYRWMRFVSEVDW